MLSKAHLLRSHFTDLPMSMTVVGVRGVRGVSRVSVCQHFSRGERERERREAPHDDTRR
jgi:hypothetical protein